MGQKGLECHNLRMSKQGEESRWIPDSDVVRELGKQFGTPLYVLSEEHFRQRIKDYQTAFKNADPNGEITFASKANSVLSVLKIAYGEGCLIDAASEGELRAALAAGVPASKCHMHGNNKSRAEIEFALASGIGQIVIDNFEELELINQIGNGVEAILRLAPGVLPITNKKISTGQQDTKFGFSIQDGSAEQAVKFCVSHDVNLVGIHCHVGSQLLDPEAQIAAGQVMAEFARLMNERHGFVCKILNVGGGRAVRYVNENPVDLNKYCSRLVEGIRSALEESGLEPKLVQEPGRALIAEAGVTIYRVGAIKAVTLESGAKQRYVVVDGGLADNPRPAMYDAVYEAIAVSGDGREFGELTQARVSGRHCETDLLIDEVELPNDLKSGDFVVVLTTGAYSSSMASNYNRYPRPATVLVRESGLFDVVQEPERFEDMLARERIPGDLQ